jgi:hypothetical protein
MARGVDLVELFKRRCRWCRRRFGVCERCFRGQRYCSPRCRKKGARKRARRRNRRYQRKKEGRANNRKRQREFRRRRRARVTDAASGVDGRSGSTLPADQPCGVQSAGAPAGTGHDGSSTPDNDDEGPTRQVEPALQHPYGNGDGPSRGDEDVGEPKHDVLSRPRTPARPASSAAPRCVRCHRVGFFVDRDPNDTARSPG